MKKRTTIPMSIRKTTHRRLKSIKNEYDTYNDLITCLLDHWDKTQELTKYSIIPTKNHTRPVKEWARHSIHMHKSTKTRLDNLGKKNDTYDDLITRLLDHWDKTHKKGKL